MEFKCFLLGDVRVCSPMSTLYAGEKLSCGLDSQHTSEQGNAHGNSKSAHGLPTKPKKAAAKTSAAYWHPKVHKPGSSPHYNVQIHYRGERHRFPLETAEKAAAAERARERYLYLTAHGWPATLAHYKPKTVKQPKAATIGEWIEAVRATAEYRPTTLTTYSQCLRQIAAGIENVTEQAALDEAGQPKKDAKGRILMHSRFDHRSGGRAAWAASVEALPLTVLSAEAVQRWKVAYIAKGGDAPDVRRRAENSVTALIRGARSLFSAKARKYAAAGFSLPNPLPFADVDLPPKGKTGYQSKIDAASLIAAATEGLRGEVFKIFCLGLLCGLRKREIDLLEWSQVDFSKGKIRIERTEHFEPKSEESVGEVDLDAELVALLRGWSASATGPFVIESRRKPKHQNSRSNYRCGYLFKELYAWLRAQGVTARKPLHELRKELGAILANSHGIFAAKSMLRHSHISTTAAYYADKKGRIVSGLGSLLPQKPQNIVSADFHQQQPSKAQATALMERASA